MKKCYLLVLSVPLLLTLRLPATKRKKDLGSSQVQKRRYTLPINTVINAIRHNKLHDLETIITTQNRATRVALVNMFDPQGELPLHAACCDSSREIVALLLNYGADVDAINRQGQRPLGIAIYRGATRIVTLLLQHGAKQSLLSSGHHPLGLAASLRYKHAGCYYNIARLLLEYNADPNKLDDTQQSPYMHVVMDDAEEYVYLMNKYNANPLRPSGEGKSALEYASSRGYLQMAHAMERMVSKEQEEEIIEKRLEQENDPLSDNSLSSVPPSDLIILGNQVYIKNVLMKHMLHKIGTSNGPCDPFTTIPISRKVLVRLAAYTKIPFQEIDHTQRNPHRQSLVHINELLTARQTTLASLQVGDAGYTDFQREAELLKREFNERLAEFNPALIEPSHAASDQQGSDTEPESPDWNELL